MAVFASSLFSRETGIHTQELETCVPLQSSDLEEHAIYPYPCLWVTLAEEPLRYWARLEVAWILCCTCIPH